ncbi:hypothetical protein Csa_001493 [Cucumis sativus]|uniref:Uncharacterized protein n=1 Tax=Cucumis sativus TaxID=3659 RepID=A0A0A0LG48_CUCSA|nr:hypothetical protein Csa_001493 [Cucumis sativus]
MDVGESYVGNVSPFPMQLALCDVYVVEAFRDVCIANAFRDICATKVARDVLRLYVGNRRIRIVRGKIFAALQKVSLTDVLRRCCRRRVRRRGSFSRCCFGFSTTLVCVGEERVYCSVS